jgi:TIR domain-containing protein
VSPVVFIRGLHRGRIGYYDDDDRDGAIVYIGDFFLADGYSIIPYRLIRYATLDQLLKRREHIWLHLTWANPDAHVSNDQRYDILTELMYIEQVINDRMFFARYGEAAGDSRTIFISHSSKDKWFVRRDADDLKMLGHKIWLDERNIKVGQSIPRAIQQGLEQCAFVIIFLSPNSVFSHWVEIEWIAKFMIEVESGTVKILPGLD